METVRQIINMLDKKTFLKLMELLYDILKED